MLSSQHFNEVSVAALSQSGSWQSRYRLLTGWGKRVFKDLHLRVDTNKIHGCETSAWLSFCVDENQRYHFSFDSESLIINGLAILLLSQVDGRLAVEIHSIDLKRVMTDARLNKHLSPSRSNGVNSIISRIYAAVND